MTPQFTEGQSVLVDGKTLATIYAHPCYIPGHRELYVRVTAGNDVWEVAVERVFPLDLAASAPALYEALKGVLGMLELLNATGTNDPIEARVYAARAALKSAEGK